MRQCLRCSGLVPDGASSCPNCDASSRGSKVKLALMVSVFAAATGCTCHAVYGMSVSCEQYPERCADECEVPLADGGDPKADPESPCFVDGGSP